MNIKRLMVALAIDAIGTGAALLNVGEQVTLAALAVSAVTAGVAGYLLIRTTAI